MAPATPAFDLFNPDAAGPVVLSVPHAGRDYAATHLSLLRPPAEKLCALEDRLVDRLVEGLSIAPTLIARAPRAWIDLNRNEAEIDPAMVDGAPPAVVMLTPKVRNGLGLIPRRLAGMGDLWRGKLAPDDVAERIATIHRPYHDVLSGLIGRAAAWHGTAILLDLHSMPPLTADNGRPPARIVIGNRFGHSASRWVTDRLVATCDRFGLSWRENSPYAGGHILERHGAPRHGVHAIQLEIDRTLYLEATLQRCDEGGLAFCRAFLAGVIGDLVSAALNRSLPLAAE